MTKGKRLLEQYPSSKSKNKREDSLNGITNEQKYGLGKERRTLYKYEGFYKELEFTNLKHAEGIFELVYIDHTKLDIEVDIDGRHSKQLWLTLMIDDYSRRVLAFYLTFEEPSYNSCMMVIRKCVKKYNRLPKTLVLDGGKEFNSVDFEVFLETYGIHMQQRPPAKAGSNNVVERLFGLTNKCLIHNLMGNTRNVQQVNNSVNPKNHVVWTLETLNKRLENWINYVYDNYINPSLQQSPKEAFLNSFEVSGHPNIYIPYDETFILMTLPSPKGKTRKVHPRRGIKLNYLYYWCKQFNNPMLEYTKVEVKFDPLNTGILYAYVNNQWIRCQLSVTSI
ncbi:MULTISPECIES: integrase catalytic domain-containing protein [Bacillaceae]|uniref:Transposase InsO family protein n=1 Tax=Virgibacillus alimentarius TaxID=698769 RepID=A0ABS4S8S5_9BACI|nr:transposase family protein [Virgibacillus alimentarius]MBP2257893.1 transposase InsO family protein [Virgibacillus alimentarius]